MVLVAGKPQNLHNENRRKVMIWLSFDSFTFISAVAAATCEIYEMASSVLQELEANCNWWTLGRISVAETSACTVGYLL